MIIKTDPILIICICVALPHALALIGTLSFKQLWMRYVREGNGNEKGRE
jgi:hypothetical protein